VSCRFGAEELHGDAAIRSVTTGNAFAEVLGEVALPFAVWCGLRPTGEQPGTSLLWKWEGWVLVEQKKRYIDR